MKPKILFLISIIVFGFGMFFLIRFISGRGPKTGELRVESQPSASVYLDGKNIGKTPYKERVAVGEYTIKLVPDSTTVELSTWQGKISVGQNLMTFVNAALSDSDLTTAVDVVWLEKITSKLSELTVTTVPDGAMLFVDDESKGTTPVSVSDLTPGEHAITITSNGFLSRSITIKTTAGYRVLSSVKLALSGAKQVVPTEPDASESKPDATGTPSADASPTPTTAADTTIQKPYVLIKDTPTGFLRVRMEPTTSATEAGRVKPGEKYSLLDTDEGWYKISFEDEKEGWVSGQYADKVE